MLRLLVPSFFAACVIASCPSQAQSPRYDISLCWMEMFDGVSRNYDTDWVSLFVKGPSDERTYTAGPKNYKKDGGPSNNTQSRQNWHLTSEPIPVAVNDQVALTVSWAVANIGTSDKQKAGKAVSDKAEEIGLSTGNPIAMGISFVLGSIVGYALTDCDASLFQQRLIINGATLNDGLSAPWVQKGPNLWYYVFDYNNIQVGHCDQHAHYNLEVYIRKTATPTAGKIIDQLEKLYIPLDRTLSEGDAEWREVSNESMRRFGRPTPLRVNQRNEPIPSTDAEWEFWMNAVWTKFKAKNEEISRIIHDNSELYDGNKIPAEFSNWLQYQAKFDESLKRAIANPTEKIWVTSGFPDDLTQYVSNERQSLQQREMAELATTINPPPQSDVCNSNP